jgi:hypothetical protein
MFIKELCVSTWTWLSVSCCYTVFNFKCISENTVCQSKFGHRTFSFQCIKESHSVEYPYCVATAHSNLIAFSQKITHQSKFY